MPRNIRRFLAYWAAMFFGIMMFSFIFVLGIGFGFDIKAIIALFNVFMVHPYITTFIIVMWFIYTGMIALFYSILNSPKPNQNPPSSS